MKEPGTTKMVPPDGGWGWIVVIGSSLINLATRSIEPSFGLLFGDLLKELGVATTGAAIIMSTLDAMINFSGLFVGPLIKKYSYRKVGILGAVLSGLALMATSRANSIAHILATYSIVGGLGFGLATASTFVALNSYFSERRGQAVGLAMAGTALGFMMMPQVVSMLLELYQFRGAVFILGAMSLNAIVGASLLQPVKWHMKSAPPTQLLTTDHANQELKPVAEAGEEEVASSLLSVGPHKPSSGLPVRKASTFNSVPNIARKRKTSMISNVSHLDLSSSTMYIQYDSESDNEDRKNQSNNNKPNGIMHKGCWARFSDMMDFDLLKDPIYLNILFGLSITYVAELNFKMVVPFFMTNLGYSKRETALALSLMAVADIAARVIVPPIYDRLHYSRRTTLLAGCTCVAIARSCLAQQTEWTPLIICLVIHGFFRGLTLINFPLVISEYATVDTFAAAFGLSMVSKGCFIVALGPFVGLIRDLTESYPICIHTQSVMILTCVIAWSVEFLILRQKHLQRKTDLT